METHRFCSMGRGLMGMTCMGNVSAGSRRSGDTHTHDGQCRGIVY